MIGQGQRGRFAARVESLAQVTPVITGKRLQELYGVSYPTLQRAYRALETTKSELAKTAYGIGTVELANDLGISRCIITEWIRKKQITSARRVTKFTQQVYSINIEKFVRKDLPKLCLSRAFDPLCERKAGIWYWQDIVIPVRERVQSIYLSLHDLAEVLCVTVKTIQYMQKEKDFPQALRIQGKQWLRRDRVGHWIQEHKAYHWTDRAQEALQWQKKAYHTSYRKMQKRDIWYRR